MNQTAKTIQIRLWCSFFLMLCLFCPPRAGAVEIPLPARVVLAKAGALIQKKAYKKAIETLTAFQARAGTGADADQPDPKGYRHPEIFFALGTCHLLVKAYGPAQAAFEQAVKRDPGHVSAWLNLAKVCYDRNNYVRAAECFGQAYEQAADKNPEHLYYSAVAYLMAGQNSPGLAAFEQLFEKHARVIQPAWRENFVHALLTNGRQRQALPHIRFLAEHYTGDRQVQWQEILLQQYLQLDMETQARNYALLLTRQAPTCAKWWKALTHVELQGGRYEQALVAMTVFSYLSPLSVRETKLLADLHLQLGIPVKAAPLYTAALEEQKDTRLLHNLVLALQQLGQPEQALAQLDRFAQAVKDSDLMMLRADLLYDLKQFQEAGETYRKTARTDKKKAGRAWLMAGYAALQIHDPNAGRQAFEKAATFESHRKAALLAIRQLTAKTGS